MQGHNSKRPLYRVTRSDSHHESPCTGTSSDSQFNAHQPEIILRALVMEKNGQYLLIAMRANHRACFLSMSFCRRKEREPDPGHCENTTTMPQAHSH